MAFDISKFAQELDVNSTRPRTIESITREILTLKMRAGDAILSIGDRLNEAKELLPHGEWLPWLTNQVEFSERTAQNFMRLAKAYAGNPQLVADLGTSKAVALLALPEKEREQFLAEPKVVGGKTKPVAEMSKRELDRAIRQRSNKIRVKSFVTNGDRYRNFSNEDLSKIIKCPYGLVESSCDDFGWRCDVCCLEFLNAESE